MDYRYRSAGDAYSSLPSSAGGYQAAQTSRVPPPTSPIPRREINANRVLTEREILEQEVRRDLELERSMAMRFRGASMYADPLPINSAPFPSTPWTRRSEFGFDERMQLPVPFRPDDHATVVERPPPTQPQLPRYPDAGFIERPPLTQPQLPRGPVATGSTEKPLMPQLHGQLDAGSTERTPMPQLHHGPNAGITVSPPPQLQLHLGLDAGFTERPLMPHPQCGRDARFTERLPIQPPSQTLLPIQPPSQTLLPIQPPSQILLREKPVVPHSETTIKNGQLPSNRENKLHHGQDAGFTERRPLRPMPEPLLRENPFVPHSETAIKNWQLPPNHENEGETVRSGVKRKAERAAEAEDLQQLAAKKWACTVCRVTAESEVVWKAHLQGKKHKRNVAKPADIRNVASEDQQKLAAHEPVKAYMPVATEGPKKEFKLVISSESEKDNHPRKENDKAKEANDPLQNSSSAKKITLEGQQKHVVGGHIYMCDVCKVNCSGYVSLNSHLGGKKHKRILRKSLKNQTAEDIKLVEVVDFKKFEPVGEKADSVQESEKGSMMVKGDMLAVAEGLIKDDKKLSQGETPGIAAKKDIRVVKKKKVLVKRKKAKEEIPKESSDITHSGAAAVAETTEVVD